MKKHILLSFAAVLAVPVGLVAFFFLLILGVTVFANAVGDVYILENNTQENVTITFMYQNHDNNEYYFGEERIVEPGSRTRKNTGFDMMRCVTIERDGHEAVHSFDTIHLSNDERKFRFNITGLLGTSKPGSCPDQL